MILGTSNIWSKFGPVALLTITKILQRIQENMESSWKNIIYVNPGLTKIRKSSKMYVLGTISFRCVRFVSMFFDFVCENECIFRKYFCGDEDWNMINFPLIKCTKAWMWISYLSKSWTGSLTTFLFSGKGHPKYSYFQGRVPKLFYLQGRVPKLFYFQRRES